MGENLRIKKKQSKIPYKVGNFVAFGPVEIGVEHQNECWPDLIHKEKFLDQRECLCLIFLVAVNVPANCGLGVSGPHIGDIFRRKESLEIAQPFLPLPLSQ